MSELIHKTCLKCGSEYPRTVEFFRKRGQAADGLRSECKGCSKESEKRWRAAHPGSNKENAKKWAKEHPERVKKANDKWRKAHPERVKETNGEYGKRRRSAHLETHRAQQRAYQQRYRAEHPEKRRESVRKWRTAHPERARVDRQNRRARKNNVGGKLTVEQITKLYGLQKSKCWWCGKKMKDGQYHADHRIPLAKGGSNDISNIVLAHAHCNLSKGAKMPYELGRLL